MASQCDPAGIASCRAGCCRKFLGSQFCDMESNCLDYPTWIIALVPAMLGLAALVLIIIVLVRIKSRKIVDRYTFIRAQSEKAQSKL